MHILHNIPGLVNSQFDAYLITPKDGLLLSRSSAEGARSAKIHVACSPEEIIDGSRKAAGVGQAFSLTISWNKVLTTRKTALY